MTQATEKTEDQSINNTVIENPNQRIVELEVPIKRGETTISSVTLNKPNVGTLRNLSLQDVLKWEVSAVNTVLTRITMPTLSLNEINEMEVSDYTSLAAELTSFLVSAKVKSQIALTT